MQDGVKTCYVNNDTYKKSAGKCRRTSDGSWDSSLQTSHGNGITLELQGQYCNPYSEYLVPDILSLEECGELILSTTICDAGGGYFLHRTDGHCKCCTAASPLSNPTSHADWSTYYITSRISSSTNDDDSCIQVTPECAHNEGDNELGANRCSLDSECQGARYCNSSGWCNGESLCPSEEQACENVEKTEACKTLCDNDLECSAYFEYDEASGVECYTLKQDPSSIYAGDGDSDQGWECHTRSWDFNGPCHSYVPSDGAVSGYNMEQHTDKTMK